MMGRLKKQRRPWWEERKVMMRPKEEIRREAGKTVETRKEGK